jgi:hypothetical protein
MELFEVAINNEIIKMGFWLPKTKRNVEKYLSGD